MAVLGYLEEVAPADSEQVVDEYGDGAGGGESEHVVDDDDGDSEQVEMMVMVLLVMVTLRWMEIMLVISCNCCR